MSIKEKIIREILTQPNKKFTKSELRQLLSIDNEKVGEFNKAMTSLVKESVLVLIKKNRYVLNKDNELFIGKFLYNTKGYGFCIKTSTPVEGEVRELFIAPQNIKNAMNEDIVICKITRKEKEGSQYKTEGEILSILERGTVSLVGTYVKNNPQDKFGFVVPDNNKIHKDIYIYDGNENKAQSYDKVVVTITKYPSGDKKPEGIVEEVLGFKYDTGVDYLSIVHEYGFKETFSPKAIHQLNKISEIIPEEELKRRKDFTNECIFTIDGEDSKDLDDAISIEKLSNNKYRLGVHIADVAHYVKEDTPLDKDALNRGTSVYLINKVIPMLPKKLSNKLCSLNPFETKLTLSVIMDINSKGQVIKYDMYESYINSKARLCYNNVSDFIEGKAPLNLDEKIIGTPMQTKVEESIMVAGELMKILEKKRFDRGALDFNFAEAKIILDEDDRPVEVSTYDRRIANDIIEEFMVVTNEVVAEHFNELDIPFVYRVHEKPKMEKLQNVFNFIETLGYEVPIDISPNSIQDILKQAKGKPEEEAINLLLLQSMQQARYFQEELGHFGLGATYYSHFTSPIRRYPDLQIHRIIKDYLNKRLNALRIDKLKDKVEFSSRISSKRERQAQKAELEFDNIKKIEFMENQIEREFVGTITSINKTHCKITLPNTIEGTLPISRIAEGDFTLLKESASLVGISSGREVTIGDKITVRVYKASVEEQVIIFDFVSFEH